MEQSIFLAKVMGLYLLIVPADFACSCSQL